MSRIKVMIVDDSALTRLVLEKIINVDDEIEVVGTANDPLIAAKKIQKCQPDVITLDLHMPRMDGLSFLKKLKGSYNIPVIVVSGNSPKASQNAIQALELGAFEIIEKPDVSSPEKLKEVESAICNAIKMAHESSKRKTTSLHAAILEPQISSLLPIAALVKKPGKASNRFYVIGASTGGPDLLKQIFKSIYSLERGFVVVQHMPAIFTRSFAERLNSDSLLYIKEAENGDRIENGKVLIVPGDFHGEIHKDINGYYIRLNRKDKINGHRPSVDALFFSAAQNAGKNATGILLTGMGYDGASGLKSLQDNGSVTIAQHESTCVVYGMPRRAIEMHAAGRILSPIEIINTINQF